jgi:hypothetical protein
VPATVHQYSFDPPELWQSMHAVPTLWLLVSLYEELFDPSPFFSFLQEVKFTDEKIRITEIATTLILIVIELFMRNDA